MGRSGSGKTTYIILLLGYLISKAKIKHRELKNIGHINDIYRKIRLSRVALAGDSTRKIAAIIQDRWMRGEYTPKTVNISNYSLQMKMPIYSNKNLKKFYTIDLYFPDPTGEALEYIQKLLEGIEVEDPLRFERVKRTVINKLDEERRKGNHWADIAYYVLTQQDYDGILLFIDPDTSNLYDNIILSTNLLILVLTGQRRKTAVEIMFSKSLYRGAFRKAYLEEISNDLKKYKEYAFDNALQKLSDEYDYLHSIIQSLLCDEKKIRFAGAFFYDAFIHSKKVEKIGEGDEKREEIAPIPVESESGEKYIESFNFLLPLYHLIHVINDARSPILYQDIYQKVCGS